MDPAPIDVEPLAYLPLRQDRWPLDVKVVLVLAMLMGMVGLLEVANEVWMSVRPAMFVTVASGVTFGRSSPNLQFTIFEGFKLLNSALMLAGAIAMLARRSVGRNLLIAGAGLALLQMISADALYWYFHLSGTRMAAPSTAGDYIVKLIWQLERLLQQGAIPLIAIVVLKRPARSA